MKRKEREMKVFSLNEEAVEALKLEEKKRKPHSWLSKKASAGNQKIIRI